MYASLQAGRAAAAALVVLFHLGGTFAQDKYFGFKPLDLPFAWGDAGVEFFFVLSGFLITITHRGEFGHPNAFGSYLAKRLLRIFPTYWLICLGIYAGALVVPSLRQGLPFESDILLKAAVLLPQDPAIVGLTGAPILFVAWSLQYELLFYAVVGAAVLNRWAGAAAVLVVLGLHASCQVGEACVYPRSFLANNLIFVFAMGVAAAYLVRSRFRLPFPLVVGLLAMLAFAGFGAFEMAYGRDRLPVDRRLVYGAIGAVVILGLAQAEDRGLLQLRQRWIKLLGDSSYALYLLHIPIISLLVKLLARLKSAGPGVTVALYVFVFLACVGTAVLFHVVLERRLLAALRPLVARRSRSESAPAPLRAR